LINLRPSLFWDSEFSELDLIKHKAIIIERVATRGLWEEFKSVLAYYGVLEVVTTLKNARYLDKKTMHFIAAIYHIPIEEFRCYKLAQSNPEHWNF
jgi:hypothetical protein